MRLRGAGAVGGDDVDVERSVDDPAHVVEAGEERLDLARRLPPLVLGVVAGIAGPAGEREPLAVRRPREVVDAVGHRRTTVRTSPGPVDGQDVERRLVLLLAAPDVKASHRPSGDQAGPPSWGPAVTAPDRRRAGSQIRLVVVFSPRSIVDTTKAIVCPSGDTAGLAGPRSAVDQAGGDVGVRDGRGTVGRDSVRDHCRLTDERAPKSALQPAHAGQPAVGVVALSTM